MTEQQKTAENIIQRHRYKFFAVGAIGTFMATLDGSILNVALPTIAKDLNCSVNQVAWVVLSYTLTLVSLLLVFGSWTQRKGYGFAYKFGFSFFFVGSLLCIFSWSLYSLVFGRIIQAIGTSMFQAVGPGLVTEVFPEKERGQGIGMMTMMVSAGLMTGPPLGGFLLEFFPWQAIFVINLPIGLLGMIVTFRYFPLLPKRIVRGKLRLLGAILISVTLFTGTLALSLISDYGITDARIWGMIIISLVSLVLFVKVESNEETALIGLKLFKNRQLVTALGAAVIMFISLAGVMILIPFYLEIVKNFQPRTVGFFLIIFPLLMFIVAPLSGRLSDKIGSRILTCIGMIVLATGLYLLSRIGMETSDIFIIVSIIVIAGGAAIFNTPNSSAIMGSVAKNQRAITSGILSTSRNIGMSTGVALGTALLAYFQAQYAGIGEEREIFVLSYHQVIYTSLAISLLGIPLCLFRKS